MNQIQIPFSIFSGGEQVPRISSLLNHADDEGPLTTSGIQATIAHIRSFYRLLFTIIMFLLLILFGVLIMLFGYLKQNTCPGKRNLSKVISAFGLFAVILCIIMIPQVCNTNLVIKNWPFTITLHVFIRIRLLLAVPATIIAVYFYAVYLSSL